MSTTIIEIQCVFQTADLDTPKTAKQAGFASRNWSKTKQVARKMSLEACRKEEAQERMEEKKALLFKERELKKAKKLLGSDFTETARRSSRSRLPVDGRN